LLYLAFYLNILLNKSISFTPFKVKYAYKLKFALIAIIKTTNPIKLIKNSAYNFVANYKRILKEA
jgi:hypothetical protein